MQKFSYKLSFKKSVLFNNIYLCFTRQVDSFVLDAEGVGTSLRRRKSDLEEKVSLVSDLTSLRLSIWRCHSGFQIQRIES